MGITVIINPQSGSGLGRRLAHALRRFEPVLLDPARAAEQLEGRVAPGDTFVVGGGDGTVSLVVETLFRMGLGEAVTAVVYPLGTGNDLSRGLALRLPPDPAGFIETLAPDQAERREVAVWKMGTRYFVNYVGLGIDAQILATADRWRRYFPARPFMRKLSLGLAGFRHPFYRIRQEMRVHTEAGVLELKGQGGVILSNVGYIVGGSRIGALEPAAPRLSVTLVRSSLDLIRLFLSRFGPPKPVLPYTLAREVLLEGGPLPAEIDGEVALFEAGRVTCAGTLHILAPPGPGTHLP